MSETSQKMGRKKGERKSVLIRVYEESAEAINQAASERRMTVADFVESKMLPCAEKAHREHIEEEYRKLGKEKK
jgi:uncharacterized protein (DUF1778 family)